MNMKRTISRTFKRITTFVLTFALACGMIAPSLAVSHSTIDNILFDASYYASNNPDVVNALGSSPSALRTHYNNYGKAEGRAPSDLFNPKYYLDKYPDLKAAYGNNYTAAYMHFVIYGINEGRQGSPTFHVEVYKKNYADLRNAFGISSSDNWEYLRHWAQYGRNEGRNAVSCSSSVPSNNSPVTQPQAVVKYVKTSNPANPLRMRSGPSTSYIVVTKLSYGTKVQVLSTTGSWSKVNVNGKIGYVSSQYLSTSNPNANSGTNTSTRLHTPIADGAKFSRKTSDNGWYGYHDINRNVSSKTPVYAMTDGTAYFYQYNTNGRLRSYGNYVKFVSSDGQYEVRYAHLSRFNGMPTRITTDSAYPCSGAANKGYVGSMKVAAGTTLGWVGTTGNSSGIHLHIEVYKNGVRIDPTSLFPNLI